MNSFVEEITMHLIKYHNIRLSVAEAIVEDEWEYIEEEYITATPAQQVAKNLVHFCMVA